MFITSMILNNGRLGVTHNFFQNTQISSPSSASGGGVVNGENIGLNDSLLSLMSYTIELNPINS